MAGIGSYNAQHYSPFCESLRAINNHHLSRGMHCDLAIAVLRIKQNLTKNAENNIYNYLLRNYKPFKTESLKLTNG